MSSKPHRLFFALRPNPAIVPAIEQAVATVRATNLLRGSWVKQENHHITLHWLGDFAELPTQIVEQAKSVATALAAAPFKFVLDHASSFRGARQQPCILRCRAGSDRELQSFWSLLGDALKAAGLGANLTRRYTPHLTIAYADKMLAAQIDIEPVIWSVQEFVLIDSHVGASHHELLGHGLLRAHDPAPVPPVEPNPADCCGEGCVHCVLDVYDAARERYEAELDIWNARQALSGDTPPVATK